MIRKNNTTCSLRGLLALLSFLSAGTVFAKTDIMDETWKEDLSSFQDTGGGAVGQEKTRSPEPAVMIDVLDLKAMEILDVLKLISQKSGLNIVAGQNIKGKVTVFLKDVEAREVLRIIVAAYGWAYVQDGENIIRIMTDKEYETIFGYRFGQKTETRIEQLSFLKTADVVAVLNQMKSPAGKVIADQNAGILILIDEPKILDQMDGVIKKMDILNQTEIFILNYANAGDMSQKISELLTPSTGVMRVDGRSNRLIVRDTVAKLKEIRALIEAFDQKNKEVLIEAKIFQVTLSDENKFGIDWEAMVSDYHGLNLASDFDILGSMEKRGKVGIGTIAADQYTVLIEALRMVGQTEILSSPRITAVNNTEAKILVGSTEPYVTTTTTTPSAGPTTSAESVSFIDVGVKLFVIPTIHEDGFITMKIRPEVSSVVRNITTGNNNTIPVVDTSEAETTVIVKDRVTIVIGGLIKEEKIKTTKKVPVLGNIPFLGMAFRSKDDLVRKTEIVLFLTPKIISGDIMEEAKLPMF
ncbi:MAG: type II secretion system protein GspD [Candidatus Omnitrophica bacterium]|nr:type II secretion system protein GspD [Candidatus Omnitrophota bacterium]